VKDKQKRIVCDFCEHRCSLADGQTGVCGIRTRRGDRIETVNYGEHISLAVDPVEKKPLYHVFPGGKALSSALYGCNFRCAFCQNSTISQPKLFRSLSTKYVGPSELAGKLNREGYPIAAFTYSEPTVWQDYMIDAAREVKRVGGYTAMVTNGFFTEEALERMVPYIDAFNIDLKGDEDFYRRLCGGHLEPVLRNIKALAGGSALAGASAGAGGSVSSTQPAPDRAPVLEVTTMVMEGEHTEDGVVAMGKLLDEAGVQVWHLSAFYPAYKMQDHAPTSPETLDRIYHRVSTETKIPHIYAFSRRHARYQQTFCSHCGSLCIDRKGFALEKNYLDGGRCRSCGTKMYGLF